MSSSSSSSSSSIQIKSGTIERHVLWMQPKHVSEHVWDGQPDTKLQIAHSTSCPNLSRSRRDTRGNYSSALTIWILLDNEDELPQNNFVIKYRSS